MRLDLSTDAVHLANLKPRMVAVPSFNHDYDAYEAKFCTKADPGRVLTVATSTESWNVWEVHPGGDELVIIISGRARFIQDIDGKHEVIEVGPNQAIINPANVPHTADVIEPLTALYITPGPGTRHLPRKQGR